MVKLGSLGQTWEQRDITYLELDARQAMIAKGVKPASVDNPIKVQRAEKKRDDSALVAEEMADGDDVHPQEAEDKADDAARAEKKERQKKNDAFNSVPDDIKADAAAEQLGAELVQLSSEALGIKRSLMKNIRRVNLAQLSSTDDGVFGSSGEEEPSKEGEQSIAEMTSNAKEEIKNSISTEKSREEAAKKEEAEKKEAEKKEQEKKEGSAAEGDDGLGEAKKDDQEGKKEQDGGQQEHSLAAQEQNQTSSTNTTTKDGSAATQ